MQAVFYNFEKTIDSTGLPTGSGTTFSIVLKGAVSLTAPIIELSTDALSYNYCYIPLFNRYYFVSSCVMASESYIEYYLAVDVLASYRSDILNSSLYVLRSASSYNLKLVDDTWTHTSDFTKSHQTLDFPAFDADGCYIITVVNSESHATANPASCMYALNKYGIATLMSELFDLDNYDNIDDLTATYFNPAQYITSCRWFPFSLDAVSDDDVTLIHYGWYTADTVVGRYVDNYGINVSTSFTLGTYTDWTDRDSKWTMYHMYIPFFGTVDIDPIYSGQEITIKIAVDYNTGLGHCRLVAGDGNIIATLSGTVGCEVAINQIAGNIEVPTSIGGLIQEGVEFVGGVTAKDSNGLVSFLASLGKSTISPVGGAIEGLKGNTEYTDVVTNTFDSGKEIASAVADSTKQTLLNPTVTSTGSDGCRYTATHFRSIVISRRHYAHYNPAISKIGGVCQQVKRLSELSGYTVVANGLIEMGGLVEERNAITKLLEGGFIIE